MFIEVTRGKIKVYLNTRQIIQVSEKEDGKAKIITRELESSYEVEETYEQVKSKIIKTETKP